MTIDAQMVAVPKRYCWSLQLPRSLDGGALCLETMTASEQMFFLGAPLAHVIDFEDHVREQREGAAMRRLHRGRGRLPY